MTKVIDIAGEVFGRLTVLSRSGSDREGKATWLCRCSCGKEKGVRSRHLRSGQIRSCGCLSAEINSLTRSLDLTGKQFNRLTAIAKTSGRFRGLVVWAFQCTCGNFINVPASSVVSGNTKSCGCLQPEIARDQNFIHGKIHTNTYRSWSNMKARCSDKNSEHYPRYGGRGIRVCSRWLDFSSFYYDMGDCPVGFSIERINNDGGYEPENCKWSTTAEQSLNRCNSVKVLYSGEELPLKIACEISGVNYNRVLWRKHQRRTTHQGEFDWLLGLTAHNLRSS